MENLIEFLQYFILINFIFMSLSHVMIAYVYSGYSMFKKMYPGTKMIYPGLKKAEDRAAIIEYLKTKQLLIDLKKYIDTHPDFPKPGILFYDIKDQDSLIERNRLERIRILTLMMNEKNKFA